MLSLARTMTEVFNTKLPHMNLFIFSLYTVYKELGLKDVGILRLDRVTFHFPFVLNGPQLFFPRLGTRRGYGFLFAFKGFNRDFRFF